MAMLEEVLRTVCDGLEAALQAAVPRADSWVALSDLREPGDSPAAEIDGRIVVSLLALQSNTSASAPVMAQPDDGGRRAPPPLWLDATVIVLANLSGRDYPKGLAMLSRAIAFLQERPVLTAAEVPGFPVGVDKVAVEFVSLDLPTAAALLPPGLRTLPFALYRLRRLPFGQAGAISPAGFR
jgi:hypothetical protein